MSTLTNIMLESMDRAIPRMSEEERAETVDYLLHSAPWFEKDGDLYIFDPEEPEVHGPDYDVAGAIWSAYITVGRDASEGWEIAKLAGVEFIPVVLRRYDEKDGFYHA